MFLKTPRVPLPAGRKNLNFLKSSADYSAQEAEDGLVCKM